MQQLADIQQKVASLEQENTTLRRAHDANLAPPLPRIAREYSPLVRVLKLFIELLPDEKTNDFYGRPLVDVMNSCMETYEKLATLFAEVDETRHFGIYHMAIEVLRSLSPLRERPETPTEAGKWKVQANQFLSRAGNLQGIIEHENWNAEA